MWKSIIWLLQGGGTSEYIPPYSMVASQFPCLLDWDGGRHGVDGLDLAVFLQSSQQNVWNLWMFRLIEPQNSDEQWNWRSSSRNESLIYAMYADLC
jgi:hypothetical protein